MIDAKKLRNDFPILFQDVNDEPLVYLDNARPMIMNKQEKKYGRSSMQKKQQKCCLLVVRRQA